MALAASPRAGLLSTWLQQVKVDCSQPGLLWLPAKHASQVLAGAGVFLERLATIRLEGAAAKDGLDAELVDRLEASCHRLECHGPNHQLWRLDGQRHLERELLLVSQQREGLQVRVEELEGELSAHGGTKRGRFRRPQPMLTAPTRSPMTNFESALGHPVTRC